MANTAEVFRAFLKLGVTSFGGPVAHLGYFREELVVRRKWVSEQQYGELVALCQFLPGPASSQVGFALGLVRGGYLGAILAWIAFTLPSALLLVLFALGAVSLDGALGHGIILGLKAVAVAVVAHAVWGMARTLTPDLRRILIGVVAAALALFVPGSLGQISAITLGIVAGLLWCKRTAASDHAPLKVPVSRRVGIAAFAVFAVLLAGLPILATLVQNSFVSLGDAFYRAGALVFGGGHVMLPLLQAEPGIAASVTPEQFLAGYGATQAVPGPLFTFSAYLGFEMGGVGSALLALVAIFLPGMLLVLGALPFWNQLRTNVAVRSALAGANAAVVGILAAALWNPVITSGIEGLAPLLVAIAGLAMLLVWKLPAWLVVIMGAMVGAVVGLAEVGLGWG
ncbi:MAG: chromate efflux transporter [Leucobacter sp.]